MKRFAFVCMFVALFAAPSSAQSLRLPNMLFGSAVAADLVTTYTNLSCEYPCRGREVNPLLHWTNSRPALTVIAGASLTIAGTWAVEHYVAPKHPKLVRVLLYTAAAWEIHEAIYNASQRRK